MLIFLLALFSYCVQASESVENLTLPEAIPCSMLLDIVSYPKECKSLAFSYGLGMLSKIQKVNPETHDHCQLHGRLSYFSVDLLDFAVIYNQETVVKYYLDTFRDEISMIFVAKAFLLAKSINNLNIAEMILPFIPWIVVPLQIENISVSDGRSLISTREFQKATSYYAEQVDLKKFPSYELLVLILLKPVAAVGVMSLHHFFSFVSLLYKSPESCLIKTVQSIQIVSVNVKNIPRGFALSTPILEQLKVHFTSEAEYYGLRRDEIFEGFFGLEEIILGDKNANIDSLYLKYILHHAKEEVILRVGFAHIYEKLVLGISSLLLHPEKDTFSDILIEFASIISLKIRDVFKYVDFLPILNRKYSMEFVEKLPDCFLKGYNETESYKNGLRSFIEIFQNEIEINPNYRDLYEMLIMKLEAIIDDFDLYAMSLTLVPQESVEFFGSEELFNHSMTYKMTAELGKTSVNFQAVQFLSNLWKYRKLPVENLRKALKEDKVLEVVQSKQELELILLELKLHERLKIEKKKKRARRKKKGVTKVENVIPASVSIVDVGGASEPEILETSLEEEIQETSIIKISDEDVAENHTNVILPRFDEVKEESINNPKLRRQILKKGISSTKVISATQEREQIAAQNLTLKMNSIETACSGLYKFHPSSKYNLNIILDKTDFQVLLSIFYFRNCKITEQSFIHLFLSLGFMMEKGAGSKRAFILQMKEKDGNSLKRLGRRVFHMPHFPFTHFGHISLKYAARYLASFGIEPIYFEQVRK